MARLMVDQQLIVLVSMISPYREHRDRARALFQDSAFVEIFVDTPLAECQRRDPKGLYARAARGELRNFTGIDSPYEAPLAPEIRVDTSSMSAEEAAELVIQRMDDRGEDYSI